MLLLTEMRHGYTFMSFIEVFFKTYYLTANIKLVGEDGNMYVWIIVWWLINCHFRGSNRNNIWQVCENWNFYWKIQFNWITCIMFHKEKNQKTRNVLHEKHWFFMKRFFANEILFTFSWVPNPFIELQYQITFFFETNRKNVICTFQLQTMSARTWTSHFFNSSMEK